MTGSLKDLAQSTVALATRKGADQAAASAYRERQVDVEWRDGKLEKLSEATTRGISLQLYVDGRYAAVSTSDLRPEALDRFTAEAVALTRALARDVHRGLPDPELYQGQAALDLELEDPSQREVSAQERRRAAEELEALAHQAPGKEHILSVTASVGDTLGESCLCTSNGFVGERRGTMFYWGASVSVKDADGRRPEEYHYASSRFRGDLPPVKEVAAQAAARAMGRLGSTKMPSAVLPMAVSNRAGGGLVGRLLGPLSAASLQQKRSFYDGKLGQPVGSALLDLTDQPHLVKGLGSRLYDGEGLAARPLPLFERGVVKNAYVDNYYGKKLGMRPTTGGMSNLQWTPGTGGEAELLAQMGDGVLVTGFLGGNSNGTTGDFSLGVQGFRVRAGRIAEPVAEMNIAGNHLEFWKRLVAVGNDPYPWSAARTPTLVFDGVQFAGV